MRISLEKQILLMYSDGGADHNVTLISIYNLILMRLLHLDAEPLKAGSTRLKE